MEVAGKHVAVLVHNYFEQAEFEEPISALKDVGVEVTVISADKQALQAMQHVKPGDKFKADLLLQQANSGDYDAVVLPGGAINADNLRVIETAQRFVIDFLDLGKPVAVICHAPWVLVSAGVVDGRRLTSYHTIQDDIVNAGGDWVNQPLVIDRNLITSRKPDDLPKFNDALIDMLGKQPDAAIADAADMSPPLGELTNEAEILADEDLEDAEELHPSSVGAPDERSDTY